MKREKKRSERIEKEEWKGGKREMSSDGEKLLEKLDQIDSKIE